MTRQYSLAISLALAACLSGCAAGSMTVKPPPPPIPGLGHVTAVTVLPVQVVLAPTRFSRPQPVSPDVRLQLETESVLKREIEGLVSSSRFGLRRLDTDDSTLQRKPWLARLSRVHVEHPEQALLRAIASPDIAPVSSVFPQTACLDIVDFAVDSTGAQYLLFVQGSGSYTTHPGSKWFDEKVPGAVGGAILGGILGVHVVPDTDLENSAVESDFFLEARLVDVADRQILWHNSVFYEKRIQGDNEAFDARKGTHLRGACERLMAPLLQAPR